MNIETLRDYCIRLPFVSEECPFGPETLVFKVMGKVFLLTGLDEEELSFNVKCDPEKAAELREHYPCVQPGYHMNKKHWNTVHADGSVSDELLKSWINHSYEMVVAGLPKKDRERAEKNKSEKIKNNKKQ